jgi:protein-disulfide isomerase
VLALIGVGVLYMLQSSGTSSATINKPLTNTPTDLADGTAIGKADAKVTVTVWADYQCPGCGILSRQIEPQIITNYVETGKVRLVFKNFAFLDQKSSTKESHDAAVAALCASDQGKFWQYHDYLFANQSGENLGQFNKARLQAIADAVGVNRSTWDSCTAGSDKLTQVNNEYTQGVQAGVTQTPTLFINNEKYAGSVTYPAVAASLDSVLGGGPVNPTPTPSAAASGSTNP